MKGHRKIAIAGMFTALISFSAIPVARAQNQPNTATNGRSGGGFGSGFGAGSAATSGGNSSVHDPGPRAFFLHAGRATPANGGLLKAIEAHAGPGSEANTVISLFNNSPSTSQQQDLLNFLRSL